MRMGRREIRRVAVLCGAAAALGASVAAACSIPVFRYALERWQADRFQVIVYHGGPLTEDQDAAVSKLEENSAVSGGALNIEVIRFDVNAPDPPRLLEVERPDAGHPLPWVEVRGHLDRGQWTRRWQGTLAEAVGEPGVFESPARTETVRRILDGDSAVWLLIAPAGQGLPLGQQLQASLDTAAQTVPRPDGIGLPGSELYAPVPLEFRFSVLAISHADPAEQQFLQMLAVSAGEWREDDAYVIPVFGRGRALEVFPYADLEPQLVADVAAFICGACSCQVKQANPGFDLLVSVNWDERLFGSASPVAAGAVGPESGAGTGTAEEESDPAESSPYVAIPPGTASSVEPLEAPQRDAAADRAPGARQPAHGIFWVSAFALAATGLFVGVFILLQRAR
jgi:hypothetical protein